MDDGEDLDALGRLAQAPAVAPRLEAGLQAHAAALGRDVRTGVQRSVLADGLDAPWGGARLRSLWLVSHRALRRAGFGRHPGDTAVLLGLRGEGLVLLRPESQRRSVLLEPWDRPSREGAVRHVVVPPDTLYDTLADATTWHLLVFHTQTASRLRRLIPTENGWADLSEETQNP